MCLAVIACILSSLIILVRLVNLEFFIRREDYNENNSN